MLCYYEVQRFLFYCYHVQSLMFWYYYWAVLSCIERTSMVLLYWIECRFVIWLVYKMFILYLMIKVHGLYSHWWYVTEVTFKLVLFYHTVYLICDTSIVFIEILIGLLLPCTECTDSWCMCTFMCCAMVCTLTSGIIISRQSLHLFMYDYTLYSLQLYRGFSTLN